MMGEKKKILIVEDERDFAKMVKMRLESVGYEVAFAIDAYQGTQAVVRNNYDLIILDLMLPAGGGFAVLERIRNMPSKTMIPVVIVTGKTINDEDRSKAEAGDVSAIFTKPYENKEFLRKIKSLVPV
jgi:DNA-binding response OmpR family regulator